MTRRPFDPGELGGVDPEMDPMLADLERYLADTAANPSSGFADEVMAAVEHGPMPRRGVVGALAAWFSAPGGTGRMALLVATAAVAILAVVALGRIGDLLPSHVGTSPSPSVTSPSPSPTPTPRETPSARPSHEASDSPDASDPPDASDDHGGGSSTPQPSDDNSGPGGGGSSGPGSSDDSSGHGSGSG